MKKLIIVLLFVLSTFAVNLGGNEVDKSKAIFYFFTGHSNMMGKGGKKDTVTHPRCYQYTLARQFELARDPIPESYDNAPSVVLPFLKSMATRYPEHHFIGCKIVQAGSMISANFLLNSVHYREIVKIATGLKDQVTFAGLLSMHGWNECEFEREANRFDTSYLSLVCLVRGAVENPFLPVIVGRFEIYQDRNAYDKKYYVYENVVVDKIDKDISKYLNVAIAPMRHIPKRYYFDDHHYNEIGYKIWSEDAIALIQINDWDWWK